MAFWGNKTDIEWGSVPKSADKSRWEQLDSQAQDIQSAANELYRTDRAESDRLSAQADELRREGNALYRSLRGH